MTTAMVNDQNLEKQIEKQMGCMASFLQLFDRHHMLTGKRFYTTKRLPPATAHGVDSSSETNSITSTPAISKELEKPQVTRSTTSPSPERSKSVQSKEPLSPVVEMPPKSPLPLPIFELSEGAKYSWKFCKESPRLSLDSRATFDAAKGSLYPKEIRTNADRNDDNTRRSTSVIARLMGLESLPNSSARPDPTLKPGQLRRSASESRVQHRFIDDNNNFQPNLQYQSDVSGTNLTSNVVRERRVDPNLRSEPPRSSNRGFKPPQQRKNFYDSADFFPEPKQTVSIYGEIERRLKMRGIDEPSRDLETLKQILEAMQLKGLLHSKKPSSQIRNKNIVYDRKYSFSSDDQSPIVLMKPFNRGIGTDSPPFSSPRGERPGVDRNVKSPRNSSSPTRRESNVKNYSSSNSIVRRKKLSIETQRGSEATDSRRVSPINSPRIAPKRNVSADQTATNRSPRNRKPTAQIYAKEKITNAVVIEDGSSSSISESTVSTPSITDTERSKTEEHKEGRRLLERCDKLLHSIAKMNAAELQPSPVSVLDSSFYKDESSSPSPVMKRSISFTDESVELEEDLGSPGISSVHSKCEDEIDDPDLVYISEILGASTYLSEEADIFLLLEKQQYHKGIDMSKASRLQRKLIFDTVAEILDRNRQLPAWKAFSSRNLYIAKPSLQQIWSDFQRIREREISEDLFEIICGVLKKDLAGDATNGWRECPVEMSEAALDIERLIFKDLVGESIRDHAEFAGKDTFLAPRRKLVF